MADMEGFIEANNFKSDVAVQSKSFYLKGAENADWGIKARMSAIFNPESGNTSPEAVEARVRQMEIPLPCGMPSLHC